MLLPVGVFVALADHLLRLPQQDAAPEIDGAVAIFR
jgi:hypothetical protein